MLARITRSTDTTVTLAAAPMSQPRVFGDLKSFSLALVAFLSAAASAAASGLPGRGGAREDAAWIVAWSSCCRMASRDCGAAAAVARAAAAFAGPGEEVVVVVVVVGGGGGGGEAEAPTAATAASSEPLSISRVPKPFSALQSFKGTAYCFATEQSSSARGSGGIEGVVVGVAVAEARRSGGGGGDDDESCATATIKWQGRSSRSSSDTTKETGR